MYLLNRERLEASLDPETEDMGKLQLWIINAKKANLQHTWFYFRLGGVFERRIGKKWEKQELTEESPWLHLEAGEHVRVQSAESFMLRKRILGVIGSTTDLALDGFSLLHGPTIDPLFPKSSKQHGDSNEPTGTLKLGLVNCSLEPHRIKRDRNIGKITFFEVSDTHPISLVRGSIADKTFEERQLPETPT